MTKRNTDYSYLDLFKDSGWGLFGVAKVFLMIISGMVLIYGSVYIYFYNEDLIHGFLGLNEYTGDYADGTYTGGWRRGKPHGQGTFVWPNGSKYVGNFRKGTQEGQGTFTWSDGYKYVGNFSKGYRDGKGIYTWPDSSEYIGSFVIGSMEGSGVWNSADGRQYKGEWQLGKKHGEGIYTWPNGDQYIGDFSKGYRDGQGIYTWPNGDQYIGEWESSKKHGQGKLINTTGSQYVGEWREGKMHGEGVATDRDGVTCEGSFNNDMVKGYGFRKENGTFNDEFCYGAPLAFYTQNLVLAEKNFSSRIPRVPPWPDSSNEVSNYLTSEVVRKKLDDIKSKEQARINEEALANELRNEKKLKQLAENKRKQLAKKKRKQLAKKKRKLRAKKRRLLRAKRQREAEQREVEREIAMQNERRYQDIYLRNITLTNQKQWVPPAYIPAKTKSTARTMATSANQSEATSGETGAWHCSTDGSDDCRREDVSPYKPETKPYVPPDCYPNCTYLQK